MLSEDIEKAIAKLNERDRALTYWKFVEGLEDARIAIMMGCSNEAVRVRTYRLKKNLRALLKDSKGGVAHEEK